MKPTRIPGIVNRRTALALNAVIIAAYIAIAVVAHSPWVMFGGILLLAVLIRTATLQWMLKTIATEGPSRTSIGPVLLNLILGLLFSAALLGVLWWLGHYWPAGIKVIVPCTAVFVAYKSTFPLWSPAATPQKKKEAPNKAFEDSDARASNPQR